MGLISSVLDRFTADRYSNKHIQWYRGWGNGANQACIMGAIGIVMHQAEYRKFLDRNGFLPNDATVSSTHDYVWMYNPELWEPSELHELVAFFLTLCEQRPELVERWVNEGRLADHFDPEQLASWQNPMLSFIISCCINFNDAYVYSFEEDLLPILEKTAIRLAEQV